MSDTPDCARFIRCPKCHGAGNVVRHRFAFEAGWRCRACGAKWVGPGGRKRGRQGRKGKQ